MSITIEKEIIKLRIPNTMNTLQTIQDFLIDDKTDYMVVV